MKEEIIKYMLFAIFKTKVEKSALQKDIDLFLMTRSSEYTRKEHEKWLYRFAGDIGIESPEELNEDCYTSFLKALNMSVISQYERGRAATALNLYKGYRRRVELPKRGVGRPSKRDRNREMYDLFKASKDWTYRKLADRYKIDVHAVFDIIKRYDKNDLKE